MASIADAKSIKIEEGKATTIEFEKERANIKSGFMYGTPGIDSPPLKDDKIVTVQIPGKEKFIVIGNLLIGAGAESGEIIIFSRDSSGEIQGKMYIKKDGTITFNGGEDFAVAFNGLKTELEKFQTTYNSHTHTAVGGSTGAPSATSSMVLDNAKIQDIKVPAGGVS